MTLDEFQSVIKIGDFVPVISLDLWATYRGCWDCEEGKDMLHFTKGDLHFQIPLFSVRGFMHTCDSRKAITFDV